MSEAANKALVRRWFDEVWNKGQEATIDKLFAENGVAYGLGDTDVEIRGPAQFKPFFRNMRGAFPDLQITIEDIVAEADKVMVRVLLQGTHGGGNFVPTASGRRQVVGFRLLESSWFAFRTIKTSRAATVGISLVCCAK